MHNIMEEIRNRDSSLLKKLEGKHTVETVAEILGVRRQSALNILTRLKKKQFVRTTGGRQQKRIYTIATKRFEKENGMFAVINRYARTKVVPSFRHIIYGQYSPENALIDAILLKDIRTLSASLYLFNHIKNWEKLHSLAKKYNLESMVGALYDFSRKTIKTRRMTEKMYKALSRKKTKEKVFIIPGLKTDNVVIKKIEDNWNVFIPLSKREQEELQ